MVVIITSFSSVGAAGFGNGISIYTQAGTYTSGHGGILQFQNEDVITGGIRAIRDGGSWGGSLLFYTHNTSAGNTFNTTFVEGMRLTSSGNLSIGNNNDTYKLDVSGTGRFNGSGSNGYLYVSGNAGAGGSTNPAYLQGMNFSWNKSNGGGESLITYTGAGGGSNIRFGIGYWNNTTYSEQFTIASTGAATFSSTNTKCLSYLCSCFK